MTVTEMIGHLQALELCGNGNDHAKITDRDTGRVYDVSSISYNSDEDVVEISID